MKKRFAILICSLMLLAPNYGRADLFGADVAVLAQILANAIQQLAQLQQIMRNGEDTIGLMREINRGINDSLQMAQTAGIINDPGVYRDWTNVNEAFKQIDLLYGAAVPSQEQQVQIDTDRGVAEAVSLNNSIYDYTREVDELAEMVKQASHELSPGGAQKLTAQTLGVVLHVMNQGLRVQSTGLKIQAQSIAGNNKRDKASTEFFLSNSRSLSNGLKAQQKYYETPRF